MLNLGRIGQLCDHLGISESVLMETLDDFDTNPDSIVSELTLWPANPRKKPRDVICVRGNLRTIQHRLYERLFLRRFKPSRYSHGAVKKRSPVTNARAHIGNKFVYVTDISSFYPTISCRRLNRFLIGKACHYKVARILTRLCTFDFHLALGLVTSPILANELFKPIDSAIGRFCKMRGLTYTRFIDDISISGQYDLQEAGVHKIVSRIVSQSGFKLHEDKTQIGRLDGDITITGVRVKKRHLDASMDYAEELERQIEDHSNLSKNLEFTGPLLTEDEILGRSFYVCGLNPGRRRGIFSKLKSIDWGAVMTYASERGLVRLREAITPRGESRPDCTIPVGNQQGAENVETFARQNKINPAVAPF